jgi:hypothetical protein
MADIYVEFSDGGKQLLTGADDNISADAAEARVKQRFPRNTIVKIEKRRSSAPQEAEPAPARPKGPTMYQSFLGGTEGGIIKGAKDSLDAAAQLVTRAVPSFVIDAGDYIPSKMRGSSSPLVRALAPSDPRKMLDPKNVDQEISRSEKEYQTAREALAGTMNTKPGFDFPRLVGNVVNPVTYAMARATPQAAVSTGLRAIGTGTVLGGVSGLLTPVTNEENQKDFALTKLMQTGMGAATGPLLPVGIALTKAAVPLVNRLVRAFGAGSANLVEKTDQVIKAALHDAGQTIDDVAPDVIAHLKDRVAAAFKAGKDLNPAELLRELDFKLLGTTATRGQVTRNPTLYAGERNLRGISGVGEPLAARFDEQNKILQGKIGDFAGTPSSVKTAGERIAAALRSLDEEKRTAASAAYTAAERETGIKAEVPLTGLAQDIPAIQERYGTILPNAIVNSFKKYGIFGGKKTHVFTMQDAETILQQTNKLRGNDPATNNALGEINEAVKKAISEASETGGPFAGPRALSAERFKLQREIPALKAAAEKSVSPDDFVRKYVFDAPSDEVTSMAALLKTKNPEAYKEARMQIGDELKLAAFGADPASDALIRPAALAVKIRKIGPQRLKAFFSDEEVTELNRIARVGAYINSPPGAAPVNFSNTASALISDALPWIPSFLKGVTKTAADQARVSGSLNFKLKPTITPRAAKTAQTLAIMGQSGGAQSESRGK